MVVLAHRLSASLQLQTTPHPVTPEVSRASASMADVAQHTNMLTAGRPTVAVLMEL